MASLSTICRIGKIAEAATNRIHAIRNTSLVGRHGAVCTGFGVGNGDEGIRHSRVIQVSTRAFDLPVQGLQPSESRRQAGGKNKPTMMGKTKACRAVLFIKFSGRSATQQ